jgi:hypothetical protein
LDAVDHEAHEALSLGEVEVVEGGQDAGRVSPQTVEA